jgi:predicted DNA-binding transcriptional regulator AlpA
MPDLPPLKASSPEISPGIADHSLLTAEEVAAILRVPRSWVYSHLDLRPTIRLGRYVRFRRHGIDQMADGFDKSDDSGPSA